MLSTMIKLIGMSIKNQYPFSYVQHLATEHNEIFYLERYVLKFDHRVGYIMLGTIQDNAEVDWKIFTSFPPYFMGFPWKKVKNNNVSLVAQQYVASRSKARKRSSGAPVSFVDSNLEKSLRQQLSKQDGPLTDTDLLDLIYFDSEDHPIVRIKDLDQAPRLHSICANNCPQLQKEDISGFINVNNIELQNCGIEDLRFLQPLTKLFFLKLYKNQIRNLQPLTTLPLLQHLYVANNKIADITPINSMQKLAILNLDHNPVYNINELKSTSLAHLRICQIPRQDLSRLPENLPALVHLTLDQTQVDAAAANVIAQLRSRGAQVVIENHQSDSAEEVS